jgi:hypothetical protein
LRGGRGRIAGGDTEIEAMYTYLTIRADPAYTRSVAIRPLVGFLRGLPELVQTGPQTFSNVPGSPWVDLCFANADETGCYAIGAAPPPPRVSVVELVCGSVDEQWYDSLVRRVAAYLGWEVVEEHSGQILYPAD